MWSCVQADLKASLSAQALLDAGPTTYSFARLAVPPANGNFDYAGGLLLPDDRVLGMPAAEGALLEVPLDGGVPRKVTLAVSPPLVQFELFGGVLTPDGIYACPGARPTFLKIALTTLVGVTAASGERFQFQGGPDGGSWAGCVFAPGLGIYAVPSRGDVVLKLPLDGGRVEAIELDGGVGGYYGAALAPDGRIVGVSSTQRPFLVLDPQNNSVSYVLNQQGNFVGGAVPTADGLLAALPFAGYGTVPMLIDVNSVAIEPTVLNRPPGTVTNSAGGALGADGKLYLAPAVGGYQVMTLARQDARGSTYAYEYFSYLDAGTLSTDAGSMGPQSYEGAVSTFDGRIVYILKSGNAVMVATPHVVRPLSRTTLLSPFMNKF